MRGLHGEGSLSREELLLAGLLVACATMLLVTPLALGRPRFSALWLVPIVLWMSPRGGTPEGVELILPALVSAVVLLAVARDTSAHTGASVVAS